MDNRTCLPSDHIWTFGVPVIASCKQQHRETNNKQRQKFCLCLAGLSMVSGRGGIGLFGGNHVVSWAVTVLPCTRHACICTLQFQTSLHPQTMQVRKTHTKQFLSVCVMVSHCSVAEEALDPCVGTMLSRCHSDMPVSPMVLQSTCSLASKPDKHNALCNTQRLQEVSAPESACGCTSELRHCWLKRTTACNTNTDNNNKKTQKKTRLCVSLAHGDFSLQGRPGMPRNKTPCRDVLVFHTYLPCLLILTCAATVASSFCVKLHPFLLRPCPLLGRGSLGSRLIHVLLIVTMSLATLGCFERRALLASSSP